MASVKKEVVEEKPDINALKLTGISPDFTSDSLEICPYSSQNDVRKFHILDETEDSDSEKSFSCDSDIPDEEIDKMLEDALKNNKRKASEAGLDESAAKQPFEEKDKVVLIEKSQNHFDVLPEGWIQVTHNSGMPLYLHKNSRVCTLSKPYFLGPGSVRKHEIPLSAIPCLSYRRALDSEKTQTPESSSDLPNARIETVKENIESQNLKPEDVRKYASKLFQFKTIKVMRFKSWSERRQFTKKRKHEQQLQRPNLPAGTKLITFPIQPNEASENTNSNAKKEWIMNPNGKSYVCILHEYVQHALKKQPTYKFTELENAATPYAATVSINDMQYGVGYGTSKKQAKSEAARATLEILIPEMKSKITTDAKTGSSASRDQDQDLSFFDEIRIEDPRVAEFCAKTTEPSPHDILLTCLQRNFGLNDLQISYQGNTLKNKKNQFTMTVGKHTATVVCKNKRDGKQRASQAILQALHPHITSWGSLLRLYGNGSVKSFKEKKLEEQEITLLQSKAAINSPNFAILDKLKLELSKLRDKRTQIKPIGVFIPTESDSLPKLSSSNLKNVDL
ncbi:microprocessor complex subunit DGCR8 [Tribolium castaneum]|uniref:Microprocessor complex subunit DGCR8-like Protein n=1 Tax=Tribolium castaneum TaxID=7070 RepID=D2A4P0_TRICA|nr:PREDICTED: microprocessor complex subunit DGCR8 [Tribolium castaneum]XP_971282.1 PREDICTED: microprocessor complex subunit DGCR8 [Tribolium castaneum]EFA05197.1 Microprocessor complex subunit DGCR8-like Protein [Tribolium castaneum]|eukprot:XP_015836202.1 PREDICTED: microprocessor complex subunit DGCR8 [Tribolium castaneum]